MSRKTRLTHTRLHPASSPPFLARWMIGEIRHAQDVENSRACREGRAPAGEVVRFSCRCNCFALIERRG
jgi:hypothetical protein